MHHPSLSSLVCFITPLPPLKGQPANLPFMGGRKNGDIIGRIFCRPIFSALRDLAVNGFVCAEAKVGAPVLQVGCNRCKGRFLAQKSPLDYTIALHNANSATGKD